MWHNTKMLLLLSIVIELYYVSCIHVPAEVPVLESNIYSSNLYTELAKTTDTSFLISSLSLKIALGMLAAGADGNTHEEILQVLHVKDESEVAEVVQNIEDSSSKKEGVPLSSANKCYLSDALNISPTYAESVALEFNSEVQSIDFSNNANAADNINRWVKEKTHGKITDIVSKYDFNQDTLLVLVNTLYFHDNWLTEFSEDSTEPGIFQKNSSLDIAVDMMSKLESTSYKDSVELNAKFLKLPYKNTDYAMYIVIPKDVDGIKNLETHIEEILSTVLDGSNVVYVSVHIPKFKTETSVDLIPVLKKLGVHDAFDDYADFDLISDEFVKVSKVIQKTFIEVDEKGTTAAAATVVGGMSSGSGVRPKLVEFRADRPFIYYIKHRDEVLFIGRYN